ncbi:MAG: aldo/keto reductase [Paracoccaceae bacterium]
MPLTDIALWNGKTVPRIGIGTWVMGGAQYAGDTPIGWADVDDAISIRTLHTTFDQGVRIIDTSNQYGGGQAEDVIAEGIAMSDLSRDAFAICTKAGNVCDPVSRNLIGTADQMDEITASIEGSLRRLKTDNLDLMKFHLNRHPIEQSEGVFEAFSDAYKAGKIGGFGWSNDNLEGAVAFADMDGS